MYQVICKRFGPSYEYDDVVEIGSEVVCQNINDLGNAISIASILDQDLMDPMITFRVEMQDVIPHAT